MASTDCRAMSKHEEPRDPFGTSSEGRWAEVPELIRRDVEQHVLAHLPADLLTKWRDQHARGVCIGSDDPFFHFGAGMAVRNLCREQVPTASWKPVGSCSIGTTAIAACASRLPLRRLGGRRASGPAHPLV